MRFHSVDYRKAKHDCGVVLDRGFWFWLRRPLLICRAVGHRPVVDGTEGFRGRPGHRWVCCDRCGVRPEPQGDLDPAVWNIGDPVPAAGLPGPWPTAPEGVIGGQIVLGQRSSCGVSVKVGNAGSEHTLAGHVGLPLAGALFLHTEQFGTWLQRRLVPDGYESRVIEVTAHGGRIWWKLWTFRDHTSGGWRDGNARLDPRDILWGEKRYSYTNEGDLVTATITLPTGDKYPVAMQLQRQSFGRPSGRKKLTWVADCQTREGIPYRHSWKGGMTGWAVAVTDEAVQSGMWPAEAVAASAAKIVGLRVRYRWKPADATAA